MLRKHLKIFALERNLAKVPDAFCLPFESRQKKKLLQNEHFLKFALSLISSFGGVVIFSNLPILVQLHAYAFESFPSKIGFVFSSNEQWGMCTNTESNAEYYCQRWISTFLVCRSDLVDVNMIRFM